MGVLTRPIAFLAGYVPPAGSISRTNKFAATVNATTTGANQTAATANCGTVTTGGLLVIVQSGTYGFISSTNDSWATPTKSSGTATVGTASLVGTGGGVTTSDNLTQVWTMPVTAGGTLVLALDDDASDQSFGYVVYVDEVTGHNAGTPIVGAVTTQANSAGQVGTPADSTLGATPATNDYTYAIIGWDADTGTNSTAAGSGFTETGDINAAYSMLNVATRTGSTSTTVTWGTETSTGTTYSYGGVAFIVKAA